MKIRHLLLAAALLVTPLGAHAGDPLNSQPNWVTASFLTGPTTVVVDVVDIEAGTTVGSGLATTQLQISGNDSIYWRFNLATVAGYPAGCEVKTYAIQFIPDGANCSEGVNPELCATATRQVGGSSCWGTGVSGKYVHTSSVVSGQGIDQAVLDFYNQRGTLPLLWIEHDVSSSGDYTAADATLWEVYFYTSSASAPRVLCTVKTTTNPSTALPSYTHCQ